jgi:uncharacterized hydrophobic protein (TIGR00271 family)
MGAPPIVALEGVWRFYGKVKALEEVNSGEGTRQPTQRGGNMELKERISGMHWRWAERRFGIWGVRDYYTLLEQMAREGAEITFGYVLMILAAALLATAGLLLDSPAVIIGSMCAAPFLGPSRAVCIGGLFRNRKIFLGGLCKQLLGLLVVGTATAYVITTLLRDSVPGVEVTQEILLRSMPTTRDVVLTVMIAVGAGAAASLALTADPRVVAKPWGQIIDAMIGVEIAISLLPPASVIGIGLALARLDISRNACLLLIVNVIGLDFLGSMLMLGLRGVRPSYLVLEKTIRKTVEDTLAANSAVSPAEITANIVLLSDITADVHATVHNRTNSPLPASLAQTVASEIATKTGYRSKVLVEVIPCQTFSTLQLGDAVLKGTRWS